MHIDVIRELQGILSWGIGDPEVKRMPLNPAQRELRALFDDLRDVSIRAWRKAAQ